jgi:DNA mismatch repair protein MLH3
MDNFDEPPVARTTPSPRTDISTTQLSRPVAIRLRSSVIIPSFSQVLSELIQNSLDAKAIRIDCWVDLSSGAESMRVEDDGCGMGRKELQAIGHRYCELMEP